MWYGQLHLCARITATALIQGAQVDIHLHQYCRQCPLMGIASRKAVQSF
jgi:hypothetical protein